MKKIAEKTDYTLDIETICLPYIKIHSLKIQGKSSGLVKREAFKAVACWRRMGITGLR
jgi:hypothetical protein